MNSNILNVLEIDDKEYLLYSLENDHDIDIYIKRIVKDFNHNDDIIDIVDQEERDKVFEIARGFIDYLS